MAIPATQRERYRYSGRVRLSRFLPWVLFTLLFALVDGWSLHELYAAGWYLPIFAPIALAVPLFAVLAAAISKGECRSRSVALGLAIVTAVIMFGGFFWFGMIALMGPAQAVRIDQLPRYVEYRMRTDVRHGSFLSGGVSQWTPAYTFDNWLRFTIEALTVTFFFASIAVRRSAKAYCENCRQWMTSSTLRFAPGRGQTIAEWLDAGELNQLSLLPMGIASNRSASTKVSLDHCRIPRSAACRTYLSVKEVRGAKAEHQSGYGRTVVPRSALSADEVATLRPLYNIGEPKPATLYEPTGDGPAALIYVTPLPPRQARRILTKAAIGIGSTLTLLQLVVFWVSIAGIYYFVNASQLASWTARRPVDLHRAVVGSIGLVGCATLCVFAGYLGLKNSGMISNRVFRLLARRSVKSRPDSIVDFSRPSQAPIFFVQRVPRKNWGRHMMETATDTGFMQVDTDANELRFEGDIDRIRIPGAAIAHVAVEHYTSEMGKTSLMYSVVTLRGRTIDGPFEAPFSIRNTDVFVNGNHRQTNADLLLSWIETVRPATHAELIEETDATDGSPSSLVYEPAQSAEPDRRSFFRRYWLRLTIIGLSLGIGAMNGILKGRAAKNNPFNAAAFANSMLSGARSAKGISMIVSNVRTLTALPGLQREPKDPAAWTVFDCTTQTIPSAVFTVAIGLPTGRAGFNLQHDVILPHTAADGDRILNALSKATGVAVPEVTTKFALQPTRIEGLRVGDKLSSPQTRFTPSGGNWVVDQWSLGDDGVADLAYFSFDLVSGRAELSQPTRYAAGNVMNAFAEVLRDGPRPPRSAANDPTYSDIGPVLTDVHLLDRSAKHSLAFAAGNRFAMLIPYAPDQPLLGVALPACDQTITMVDGLPGQITQAIACDADVHTLLVATHDRSVGAGAVGGSRYWLVDRLHLTRREIVGPWGKVGSLVAGQLPVSPDGRYAVFQGSTRQLLNPEAPDDLYVYDLQTGQSKHLETTLKSLAVLTWASATHAMLGDAVDDDSTVVSPSSIKLDLDCAAGTALSATPQSTTAAAVSPDNSHRFEVQVNHSITVIGLRTGGRRTLQLSSADCPYATSEAFQWLGNRYLNFFAKQPELFDTEQMKFCARPVLDASPKTDLQFSDDFQYAWMTGKAGVTLGRVRTPDELRPN